GITAGFTDTDGNHTGSTATNTVSLTVNKAATAFTIFVNGSSSASVTYGSTAILAESGLPAGATGLVTFFTSGGIPLCAFIYGFLPGGTTTSCNVWPNLPVAAYSGIYATFIDLDGNYLSSKAPNTVALTVTKATPKVTWPAPAPITYGTRLGGSQLDATASVPGTFSYSPAAATVLQPGTQTLSVTFSPMDATDYSSATASTTILVGFTQACLTTTDNGSLAVSKGQAICIGPGGRVTGSVSVASGGALWVSAGTIGGSLGSTGALGITVCGTKVTGSVTVAGSSGPVILGGSGCAADTLGGSVNVTGSTAGVLFDSSTVTGSLTISNNSAGVTVSGNDVTGSAAVSSNSGGVTFTNNTVWGSLAITYNTGPFAYSGNVVHGSTTNKGNT
ncbi:MAG: hypothetical protein ABSE47_05530, partial [Acidimicrobiales bacterium]